MGVIGFCQDLSGTVGSVSLCWALSCSVRPCQFLSGSVNLFWALSVLPGFFRLSKALSCSVLVRLSRVLSGFVRLHLAWSSFVRLCQALSGSIWQCGTLYGFAELCRALSHSIGICLALYGFVEISQSLLCSVRICLVLWTLFSFVRHCRA